MKAQARIAAMALCVLASSAGAKEPVSLCRPEANVRPDTLVVAVAVDRTAPREAGFVATVEAAVAASIRPNVHLVLWRFGGMQSLPQLVMDLVMPRLPEERADIQGIVEKMFHKAGHGDKVRECVLEQVEAGRRAFLYALHAELTSFDPSPKGWSPIVLATSQVLQPFAHEAAQGLVNLWLLTDGFEFSANANFYANSTGHYPTAIEAVAQTRQIRGLWRGAKIIVAGLGVTTGAPDVAGASAMLDVWDAIIVNRGGIPVQLTTGAPQQLRD